MECKKKHKGAIEFRDRHTLENESKKWRIREIVNNHHEGIQNLEFVVNDILEPEVFNALMAKEAYTSDTAECAKTVQVV